MDLSYEPETTLRGSPWAMAMEVARKECRAMQRKSASSVDWEECEKAGEGAAGTDVSLEERASCMGGGWRGSVIVTSSVREVLVGIVDVVGVVVGESQGDVLVGGVGVGIAQPWR